MDKARSLASGGRLLTAEYLQENELNPNDLILRCSFCGELVYFRTGHGNRKPHFAHFPEFQANSFEECELRQKDLSSIAIGIFSFSAKGEKQRLKILQFKLLEIFGEVNLGPNKIGIEKTLEEAQGFRTAINFFEEWDNQYSGQILWSQSPVVQEVGVVRMGFNQSWVKV
jgi:hypothetical protein